jgi:hypothetical protein
MPFDSKVWLDFPDEVTTTQPAAAGEVREFLHATHGKQWYKLVKNTSGGAILNTRLCAFTTSSNIEVAYAGATTLKAQLAGIAVLDIPNNSYGWVVCRGQCTVDSSGTTVLGEQCRPAATGTVESDSTPSSDVEAAQIFGYWVEAGSGAAQRSANISVM